MLSCFAVFCADGDGRVTGADATKFFAMSGLPRADLKQVWAIADSKRQGYLGFGEFAAAMQVWLTHPFASPVTPRRGWEMWLCGTDCFVCCNPQLVSLAQAGNEITQDSLKREGCC